MILYILYLLDSCNSSCIEEYIGYLPETRPNTKDDSKLDRETLLCERKLRVGTERTFNKSGSKNRRSSVFTAGSEFSLSQNT